MVIVDIAIWVAQGLLALGFGTVGFNHAFRVEKLQAVPRMDWIKAVPPRVMTFIGLAEMAGGLGVLLPMLTGVLPWLTPLAAALLAVVMVLAFIFHVQRKEYPNLGINTFLFLVAAFVAWGLF